MLYSALLALAGTAAAQGVAKGFNYGNVFNNGAPKQLGDYEAEFRKAQSLANTDGFTSARLYTTIQAGTTSQPISAIQAAINTQTSLLLGLWASAGSDIFQFELDALEAAIAQYGTAMTDLIVGISVGSEDLYRISVQGIENDSGVGVGPDVLVDYIQRTRQVIADTSASAAPIGHVDTWNDWVNGSNSAVLEAVDWIGFNAFPYWEATRDNNIENANTLFFNALNAVEGVAQDKPIWITETGWPVQGPDQGQSVASIENSKAYWDSVGCEIFDNYNTWWYILRDNNGSPAPLPSFGIVGRDLGQPLFDLTCPAGSSGTVDSTASSVASSIATSSAAASSVASSSDAAPTITSGFASVPASSVAAPTDDASSVVTSTIVASLDDASSVLTSTVVASSVEVSYVGVPSVPASSAEPSSVATSYVAVPSIALPADNETAVSTTTAASIMPDATTTLTTFTTTTLPSEITSTAYATSSMQPDKPYEKPYGKPYGGAYRGHEDEDWKKGGRHGKPPGGYRGHEDGDWKKGGRHGKPPGGYRGHEDEDWKQGGRHGKPPGGYRGREGGDWKKGPGYRKHNGGDFRGYQNDDENCEE